MYIWNGIGTISGEANLWFSFLPPFKNGSTFSLEQVLPSASKLHFKRALLPRDVNKKSQKLFPFAKMAEKKPLSAPVHLKYRIWMNVHPENSMMDTQI